MILVVLWDLEMYWVKEERFNRSEKYPNTLNMALKRRPIDGEGGVTIINHY